MAHVAMDPTIDMCAVPCSMQTEKARRSMLGGWWVEFLKYAVSPGFGKAESFAAAAAKTK